ncbi:MAG: tetratricopeptide repeat protein [Oceanococcus sp.]
MNNTQGLLLLAGLILTQASYAAQDCKQALKTESVDDAVRICEQATRITKQRNPKSAQHAASLYNLAQAYRRAGAHEKALALFRWSSQIYQQQGENKLALAASTAEATSLMELGRYAEAEALLSPLIDQAEVQLGAESIDLAIALNALGGYYRRQGQSQRALPLYQRSLLIAKNYYLGDHPQIAQSLNNLGGAHLELGQLDQAKQFHQQALTMRRKTLSKDHESVGRSLHNIANIYLQEKNYPLAKTLFMESLEILSQRLGSDHIDLNRSHRNLAYTLAKLEDAPAAIRNYQAAIAILQVHFKNNPQPDLSQVQESLAKLYLKLGQDQAAKTEFLNAAASTRENSRAQRLTERAQAIQTSQ